METTLVIVTGISLALALGLGLLLWRLLRDERQRADARVAALVDGFAQRSAAEPDATTEPSVSFASPLTARAAATHAGEPRDGEGEPPIEQIDLSTDTDWLSQFPSAAREPAPDARTLRAEAGALRIDPHDLSTFDFDLPRASDSARVLFGQVEDAERANEPNHLMTAGVVAALLVGLVLAIWTVSHLVITMTAAAQPASVSATAGAGAAASASASGATPASASAPASASVPLELLALRHDQDGGTLTISGLVRNPPNAARQDHLTAVIFFFNQRGDFQTSVRAPLDFRALAPGDESPFKVSISAPAGVSRFRVSFRHDEGDVVPHVDRRQAAGS
jgi:hypothetical protein